jgi:lactoylglutathione lyase
MNMDLGNFSVSLAVKDIAASRAFYEKLGFAILGGEESQCWLIMKSPSCVIGLFQGMFEKNTLTFNPGWDAEGRTLDVFTDVREIQQRLKAARVAIASEADESTSGPASFVVVDPDGNPILIDQHV